MWRSESEKYLLWLCGFAPVKRLINSILISMRDWINLETIEEEETKPNICRKHTHARTNTDGQRSRKTHKFEQEGVFSQGADAAGEAEDEHHPSDYDEEPHGIKAAQIRDGWQVRQHALWKYKRCVTMETKQKNICPYMEGNTLPWCHVTLNSWSKGSIISELSVPGSTLGALLQKKKKKEKSLIP